MRRRRSSEGEIQGIRSSFRRSRFRQASTALKSSAGGSEWTRGIGPLIRKAMPSAAPAPRQPSHRRRWRIAWAKKTLAIVTQRGRWTLFIDERGKRRNNAVVPEMMAVAEAVAGVVA